MDLKNLNSALDQLADEKGISKEKILETVEMALAAAYKKDFGERNQIIRAKFDLNTGKSNFLQVKIVVDDSMLKPELEEGEEEELDTQEEENPDEPKKIRFNEERHIMLKEAKKIKKDVKLEEELLFPLKAKGGDYGRIASQTAKQVILQRIREAERESVYEEYAKKQGEVISGIIQRVEGRTVFLDLGRGIGLMPPEEQVRGERYRLGDRIKALLFLVEKNPKGPGIYLSRSHPRLVYKLFEIEVPEIASGVVEIKNISREAGSRTKIAVVSNDDSIDAVGSCVGQKGVRVTTVIAELGGEKIDIIPWNNEPEKFIANAVSPAKALDVEVNSRNKTAKITVAEDQLSLAIGKGGQNVRLAAKLTGYKIDVRSRSGETVAEATSEGEVSGEGIAEE